MFRGVSHGDLVAWERGEGDSVHLFTKWWAVFLKVPVCPARRHNHGGCIQRRKVGLQGEVDSIERAAAAAAAAAVRRVGLP